MKKIIIFSIVFLTSTASFGYESSEFVNITLLRPTHGGNAYFEVDNPTAMCGTSAFMVNVSTDGAKAMYSTLLSAAMSGKKVKIETWGACADGGGWGTEVQGVYVQF